MDNRRIELQRLLEHVLHGERVYYQPPESIKMKYPAIIYQRSDIRNLFADDHPYRQSTAYQVTVVDKDPDSEIVKRVARLPMCRFDRHYTADGLNHDVFIIYF